MPRRDFNRLSFAVLTSMATRRPLRLTLADERELVGVPSASTIDQDLARRNVGVKASNHLPTRNLTIEGQTVAILEVEAARWA